VGQSVFLRINDGKFAKFTNFLLVVSVVGAADVQGSAPRHGFIFHFRQLVWELALRLFLRF